ncbi:hypothetical protein [Ponticoccus litoralis]|uniref:Uncharacterized protein n=1 Tax=Ponticoccus litoralis TaxID=422297 RepID=A0AAW9SMV9_9RHOB
MAKREKTSTLRMFTVGTKEALDSAASASPVDPNSPVTSVTPT